MIYDLLKEVREEFGEHKDEQVKQGITLAEIKKDLKYHIKRTDILEDLHKDNLAQIEQNKTRLERLEEPVKARVYLFKKWQFWTGLVAITAGAIAKIIGLW